MATTPMTTLAQVQTWLGTLQTGQTVDVSAALFDAPLVSALFALLPDTPSIGLTVTAADAQAATLTGTATVLGEAGTTAAFAFSQPAQALLCELALTLPTTLEWALLPSGDLAFTALGARFVPDPDLNVVGLSFSSTLVAGTTGAVQVPVVFTVPSSSGDWTLSGSFTSLGALTADALTALNGGNSITELLPSELTDDLSKFSLTGFEVAFNPVAKTCSLLRVALQYTGDWTFFGGQFTVHGPAFAFEVLQPFTSGQSFSAALSATMQITGLPAFDVGGQFLSAGGSSVFVALDPSNALDVGAAFAFFGVSLPSGFPTIDVTTLSFILFPGSGSFDFKLAIAKPVPILGDAALDSFLFEIAADYDAGTKKLVPSGQMAGTFSVGQTTLSLSGTYAENAGLALVGTAAKVPVGELIAKLGAEFGIENVPAPIAQLVLETMTVKANTGSTPAFSFTCAGTTTLAGTTVTFTPTIDAHYDTASKTFSGAFSGTLVLSSPQSGGGTKDLTFGVTFSTSATDTWMQCTYQSTGQGLEFEDIASALGFTNFPTIPSDLDLALTSAGFRYDFSDGSLVLEATSQTYGKAAFVTMNVASVRQYFFLLGIDQTFSLSELPLVGEKLAAIENVSIGGFTVLVSSLAPVSAAVAGQVNDAVTKLFPGYPTYPKDGVNGTFVLSAQLVLGTDPVPLRLALGGTSDTSAPSTALAAAAGGTGASDGTTWFDVQRSFGPVTIQRIGALYQSSAQMLWFELDAALAFGPLSLSLTGLGVGSPLSTFAPHFDIRGLGASYAEPPLTLAGSLVNLEPPGSSAIQFEGGVTIGTGEFTLTAFGYYGNASGFPSMFVFGDLAYPFGGPPAFFVTGVALGFGYNSGLRIPTIDEVVAFPFVQVLPTSTAPNPNVFGGANPTPLTVLDTVLNTKPPWVQPSDGALWFGAGITFTSFELVNSQALVLVTAGKELVIALVGTSRAQFPQPVDGVTTGPTYAYVELDLEIVFAPGEGVFSLQALLAPTSFLLDRACALTGGFAFFVWFGDNPHAGDFVITLGGYNPGFTPPSYYPATPRVGFHWSLDSSITIQGGAYFALTPAALMLGGELDATYQAGNLKAWFDAHADIIIQWKPFWFDAGVGITIGASYKLDLLFTTATISVELGCDLEIWGPPTGGSVTVDWYVISFTIPFGNQNKTPPKPQGWSDVAAMLPGNGTPAATPLTISPAAGLHPATTAPPSAPKSLAASAPGGAPPPPVPWTVRGGTFAFSTGCSIPASSVTVGSSYAFSGTPFNVYPLLAADPAWKGVTAAHAITIAPLGSPKDDVSGQFSAVPVLASVPASLWGAPPSANGNPQVPAGDAQLVPNQITGVALSANPPQIGRSAGPVDAATSLAFDQLSPDGVLPLSASAQPVGDVPADTGTTIGVIADQNDGIAAPSTVAARTAIFTALGNLKYAPLSANAGMSDFAKTVGCSLAAAPLLVS